LVWRGQRGQGAVERRQGRHPERAAGDPRRKPRRDPALSRQDRAARQAAAGRMTVAIGLGLMEFPFAGAGDYWRWVDLCEAGGIDSLWHTDRLVSRQPILECMAVMAALAGRTRPLRLRLNGVSLAPARPVFRV